jgi:hypothetical protein
MKTASLSIVIQKETARIEKRDTSKLLANSLCCVWLQKETGTIASLHALTHLLYGPIYAYRKLFILLQFSLKCSVIFFPFPAKESKVSAKSRIVDDI